MSQEESSAGIVAFVFALMGLIGVLPCIGPIIAIIAGAGDRTALGRAGVVIGWITLAIYALLLGILLVIGGVALVASIASN
jgi:hypothetical protein